MEFALRSPHASSHFLGQGFIGNVRLPLQSSPRQKIPRRTNAAIDPSMLASDLPGPVGMAVFGGFCVGAASRRSARRSRQFCTSRAASASAQAFSSKAAPVAETSAPGPDFGELLQAPSNLREWRVQEREKLLSTGTRWPAPINDRLLRAAQGKPVDRPPKWCMRQAGRYLPEYQALLDRSDFFTVCKTPTLASEVTLQPYRRFPSLDALIIFSDILVIPVAMGMGCRMVPEAGPQFDFALTTPQDIARLDVTPDVEESLGYVFDAVFWTRQQVGNEVPVIGFSGAPWTLMGYMVEGGASRSFDRAKKWLYMYPEESKKLLHALRNIIVEYLVGQYDAGAPLLQVFDTNCGEIPPQIYEEFCVDDLKYIATEVKRRRPNALMSLMPKDGEIGVFEDSDYDVIGVSWKTSPAEARRACPSKTLQGNLDPYCLFADPAQIRTRVQSMVHEFGIDKYIANLGHGMMPSHPVEGVQAFMDGIDTFECTPESSN